MLKEELCIIKKIKINKTGALLYCVSAKNSRKIKGYHKELNMQYNFLCVKQALLATSKTKAGYRL